MKKFQKGFNLIDLQLSIGFMFIVILIFGNAYSLSFQTSKYADSRFQSVMLLHSAMEMVKNNPGEYLITGGEEKLSEKLELSRKPDAKNPVFLSLNWEIKQKNLYLVEFTIRIGKLIEKEEIYVEI